MTLPESADASLVVVATLPHGRVQKTSQRPPESPDLRWKGSKRRDAETVSRHAGARLSLRAVMSWSVPVVTKGPT